LLTQQTVQRRWLVLGVVIAGACARGRGDEVPDGGPGDDAPGVDAEVDAPPDAMVDGPLGGPPVPLLLTEVVLSPTEGELVEILNPTDQTVSLNGYYLADHGAYFRVPTGAPVVDVTDFIVRFPVGAVIGPRAVITVAVATASAYETIYGAPPTFSIASGTMVTVSSNGIGSLTNGGELIALFYWNGQDDLVRDVDLLLAGVPGATNGLIDKSGVALDGPDPGTTTTAYAADARTMAPQASAPPAARSTKRISPETGYETQDGTGNGLTGDDETSEIILSTWDSAFTVPTPGTVPPELMP
jgi:hypothetical protein